MSDYTQTTVALVIILLGIGIVGSFVAIVWARVTEGSWPDRDTALGLVRIFMGGAFAFVAFAILYRYVLK